MTEQKYFRKGFKMRENVQHLLDRDYRSEVVDRVRENGNVFEADGLTIRLADEFGFCYGVDRAVDYAFQTREKFPDRRIFITGDMIHNASMNDRLREMGIEFLSTGFEGPPEEAFDDLSPEDVVLLPAFGAPIDWVEKLKQKECVVVDTTCGSVLSVWKRVTRYAGRGFTSIIHGKYYHEETKATASQTLRDGGNGKYLIVRNLKETGYVTDFILGRMGAEELNGEARARHVSRLRSRRGPAACRRRQPDHDAYERDDGRRRGAQEGDGRALRGREHRGALRALRHHLLGDPG